MHTLHLKHSMEQRPPGSCTYMLPNSTSSAFLAPGHPAARAAELVLKPARNVEQHCCASLQYVMGLNCIFVLAEHFELFSTELNCSGSYCNEAVFQCGIRTKERIVFNDLVPQPENKAIRCRTAAKVHFRCHSGCKV